MKLTKSLAYTLLVTMFVGSVLLANVVAGRLVEVGALGSLTAGAFVFPLVYISSDVLAEVYGYKKARVAIFAGFALNLVAAILFTLVNLAPAPVWFTGVTSYQVVLGTGWRVLAASLTAYLTGSFLNTYVMVYLKGKHGERWFKSRAMLSTLIGELADSSVFVIILFTGAISLQEMFIMIALQAGIKVCIEFVVLPITTVIVKKLKTAPEN